MKYPNFQAVLQDVPHCTTSWQMDADLKDRVFEEFNSPLGCGSDECKWLHPGGLTAEFLGLESCSCC